MSIADPLGRVTEYDYVANALAADFGWLSMVTYAVGTADEASVSFEYDVAGNVTAFKDELNRRTEYDSSFQFG